MFNNNNNNNNNCYLTNTHYDSVMYFKNFVCMCLVLKSLIVMYVIYVFDSKFVYFVSVANFTPLTSIDDLHHLHTQVSSGSTTPCVLSIDKHFALKAYIPYLYKFS